MQVSATSQRTFSASFFTTQAQIPFKHDGVAAETQQTEVVAKTESAKIVLGYDLADMTSDDMLGLAKSFYNEGNMRDFLSLAVYSARAALEDHPDPYVTRTWTTPRNKNGTFNLLSEIQATPKYSTGSSVLDAENEDDREHLLKTLLSLPEIIATIEQTSIKIKA